MSYEFIVNKIKVSYYVFTLVLSYFTIMSNTETRHEFKQKEIEIQRRLSLSNEWLSSADFNGNGDDILFTFNDGLARWGEQEHKISAQPLCASAYDSNNDGKEELYVGYELLVPIKINQHRCGNILKKTQN